MVSYYTMSINTMFRWVTIDLIHVSGLICTNGSFNLEHADLLHVDTDWPGGIVGAHSSIFQQPITTDPNKNELAT